MIETGMKTVKPLQFGKVYRVDAPTRELAENRADVLIAEKQASGILAEKDYVVMPTINGSVWVTHDVVVFTNEQDDALNLHRRQEEIQARIVQDNEGKTEGRIARMLNTHPELVAISRRLNSLLQNPEVVNYDS